MGNSLDSLIRVLEIVGPLVCGVVAYFLRRELEKVDKNIGKLWERAELEATLRAADIEKRHEIANRLGILETQIRRRT